MRAHGSERWHECDVVPSNGVTDAEQPPGAEASNWRGGEMEADRFLTGWTSEQISPEGACPYWILPTFC